MARSQPYTVACSGGLVTASNAIDLLKTPGVATELKNFEVSTKGGYRRINGFTKFGGGSAVQPTGSTATILGAIPYADGVVVCAGTSIYFSQTGTSWMEINRSSVSASGVTKTAFELLSVLTRTNQAQCQFALFESATSDYGTLVIADGVNKPYAFRMEGTGALNTRTFFGEEITVTGTKGVEYITVHDKHLIAAGVEDNLNTIFYSGTLDPTDFTSTGSGSIALEDQVKGIKSFRNELFIFCENSIFKLQNINNSSTIAVVPVTKNVGCLSGHSIQEIGGDLIFLAPDGLRTVAGTARIGDVELGTVSSNIQNILSDLAESINIFTINSVVLREKSQYRLFYTNTGASDATQRGIIGTLRPNGFEWSETRGLEVTAIGSGFDNNGVEQYYHGDTNGNVYLHDNGNDFNGTAILARYTTPDYDYGDLGTLKTLHFLRVSMATEGIAEPDVQIKFDFNSSNIQQPSDLFDLGVINPPSLFGDAVFNTNKFAGQNNPMIRVPLQGSGTSNNFTIISNDTKPSYTVNGLYVDFIPSGRR
tara:strand:+ start:688 stop:2295 length:1608 start_codon:yes stop_codon:yes gene_type:complete